MVEATLVPPHQKDGSTQAVVPVTISDRGNGNGTHELSFTMQKVCITELLSLTTKPGHVVWFMVWQFPSVLHILHGYPRLYAYKVKDNF